MRVIARRRSLSKATVLIALGMLLAGTAWSAVGTLPALHGVSESGGAQYTVPIEVTPGIGAMTPQLAITYAGPDARTTLGIGFAVSGFPAIAPCPRTIAQDGVASPVTLTSNDRYCLNGSRLRLVSGVYGDSNAVYRTEIDQLARVTSYASTGGVPGYFKVETRDGLIHEYGGTANARFLNGTAGGPQLWALSRISDRSGNSIV